MAKTFCLPFLNARTINRHVKNWNFTLSALLLSAMLLAVCFQAQAQPAEKIWKIGVLVSTSHALNAPREDNLWEGLRQLGYVEGRNITLDYRYANGHLDRLPELAEELVGLKVDVLVVSGTRAAVATKKATSTIPIVLAGVGDPVQAGLGTVSDLICCEQVRTN